MMAKLAFWKPFSILAAWVVGRNFFFTDFTGPLEDIDREIKNAIVTCKVHIWCSE